MFTRLSNFTYGNYQIANLTSTEMNVDVQLLIQIQKYETECLNLMLGDVLYNDFMSNLELDSDGYWKTKASADVKWGYLLNGYSYQNGECDRVWRGLVTKVATIQTKDVIESMMSLYIFYKYSLNTRTLNTGTGEAKLTADNTTQDSSRNKRVDAWNEFCQWAALGFSKSNVSLNQFLADNAELYGKEDCSFTCLNTITYYDI